RPRLRGWSQRRACRAARKTTVRKNLRGHKDSTAKRGVARATRGAGDGDIPCLACHCLHGRKSEESRAGRDRRAAVPRLVGRRGEPGRLAGCHPETQETGQNPIFWGLNKRPSTGERDQIS